MSGTSPLRPGRPRPHRLADLATALGLEPPTADADVTGVTHDSAAVRLGDLLAALPGSRIHGARFAAGAAAAGAAAVFTDPAGAELAAVTGLPVLVADRPRELLGRLAALVHDDPTAAMLVLGVTGTNGKTTTAYLLEEGLRAAGHVTGLIGTVETRVAGESVPSKRTTPEATDLQATFATMRERGVTAVAMEVSSHALALGRVDGTRFAAGAFTNLSQDHLDFHDGMEDYFAAKAMLFDGRCEHEVVVVDDEWGRRLVRSGTVTVSVAGDPAADWLATDLTADQAGGQRFRVLGPGGVDLPAALRLPGAFNVANALLAVATLATVGVDPGVATKGVEHTVVPGRMEPVDAGQPWEAYVDYAHKPGAVRAMLSAVRSAARGRVITVLGCGGDRDPGKRPVMGGIAAAGSDLLIVTDDNPRSESPAAIRAE
ncbi:MAG TPA: UDP-N-acetylmuramoyl-L-alanyl-D-glutamate--2,6-diaminopimelate ligase, partial [Mycobacteriales bacterium]|nr:UDP-N-acetylmuramoyl-L-alanyl-D-glutamate--2,6-diaminopimelate ligase [Mycobacteriales bacterium]